LLVLRTIRHHQFISILNLKQKLKQAALRQRFALSLSSNFLPFCQLGELFAKLVAVFCILVSLFCFLHLHTAEFGSINDIKIFIYVPDPVIYMGYLVAVVAAGQY